MKSFRAALVAASCAAIALRAQTVTLPAEVVTASRAPQPAEQAAFSVTVFDAAALRAAPAATLDGALRSLPAFSLFRRSDSLVANPTAQGVSLRGLGPSGASRSLVLLDGVPLNDPFGGWVAWTKLPRAGLARAELVPGGGATAWGNASLGGVIQLFTAQPTPAESNPMDCFPAGSVTASAGDFSTRSAELSLTQPVGRGVAQLMGRDFSTDGWALIAPERRGPIDLAAWSRHRWLSARWHQPLGENLRLTATAREYEELRGNGTPYTRNGSREKFFSATLAGTAAPGFTWSAVVYAQDQSFASTFSSVNATRTAETPASDQFAVPATAFGAAWTGNWTHGGGGGRTSAGGDLRTVRGETRENFTFTNGAFTRQRIAGGAQAFVGIFALHERPLDPAWRATFGLRLDAWRGTDGHRRESDRATGAVLRDDHYAGRDGTEFSPSAGLVWKPAKSWRVHANAQQAFRVPTLNELYRPFRQGTTVVETNSELRTERVTAAELGAHFTADRLTLGVTGFWNDLRNAVSNVTLARGPGTFPLFGTLPAGGTGRQRLNVDRTRVQGLELSASWRASDTLSLKAEALLNDATVRRAAIAPSLGLSPSNGLAGKQVSQVPRHSVSLGATWRAPGGITFTPRLRWIGRQFEDDENTLRLGEAVVADLGASRALTPHLELFLTVENVGHARLETGRSADGVVALGTPRLMLGGLRGTW